MSPDSSVKKDYPTCFFHGSANRLDVGAHILPRADFAARWGGPGTAYEVLETYRPSAMRSRAECVFMADDEGENLLAPLEFGIEVGE